MLWKDKYELGVPSIDVQHMELFQRVEVFMKVLRSSATWDEKVGKVNETLEFMNAYVVEHFRDEEAYQEKIGYPGREEHKKIHRDMVNYVLAVTEEYERSGYDEQLMQKFAGRLVAWLINHVAAEDQRIASYAISKGVAEND
ncbi:bacteriohemerythrin [Lacrimispora indolis]|uniref:bacteriohemerythrin n=1 Tax=Lacrimispora indolis TaxID=69825 RepID=UPI00042164A6|nr:MULTISPECIES: hemerythrin family protein [Lachnospiraceae]MBE7720570.1 bacteriohemerythrin [Lacrimispora celerecrescens]